MEDMKRAGKQYEPLIYDEDDTMLQEKEIMATFDDLKPISSGKAVLGREEQLAPAETPMEGHFHTMKDLGHSTKKAFSAAREAEPFPVYLEPAME